MARLQILELPTTPGDDQPPFILVIDEWDTDSLEASNMLTDYWDAFGNKIGARGVLFAKRTINIPANDTTAYLDTVRRDLPADASYEMTIDGKIVDWTRADELHARAVEAEQKLKADEVRQRVDRECRAALADALGMNRTRDWDTIHNAARELRKEHDAQAATIGRVRAESARIRATTRTWEPAADLIDAALDGRQEQT